MASLRPSFLRAISRSLSSTSASAITQQRSVKRELELRFAPFCLGIKPIIVDVTKKVDAEYSLTSAMEVYRAHQAKFAKPNDAARAILEASSGALKDVCQLSQAKFYINATLTDCFIGQRINSMITDGVAPFAMERASKRVVIDYSSPNIAKQMHVGHLRSTLIGNSIAHLREYMGDQVVRVNHLGDWGTQFGTLLQHMRELWGDADLLSKIDRESLEGVTKLYQDAKQRFEQETEFRDKAKQCTVQVQSGKDELLTRAWKQLVEISLKDFNRLYTRLGVWQDPSWFVGESFYQNKLSEAIQELQVHATRQDSSEAILLYTGLPEAKVPSSKKDEPPAEIPLVLKKSDGGIGYDATDVAALRYRLVDLRADEVVYVTDSGQSLHFNLVFHSAKLAKWLDRGQALTHVSFGIVTKEQGGGRIRTREGNIQTLDSLLNKAVERMKLILRSKRAVWSDQELRTLDALAEPLGVLCVVFSELRTTRTSDYEFSVEKMCNPDGNSGLFVVHSMRKASLALERHLAMAQAQYKALGASPKERALACELLKVHEVMEQSALTFSPHVLAAHLLNVAAKSSSFIDESKLLASGQNPSPRLSNQIALVRAAELVMKQHVALLGMHTLFARCEPHIQNMNGWTNADALI